LVLKVLFEMAKAWIYRVAQRSKPLSGIII